MVLTLVSAVGKMKSGMDTKSFKIALFAMIALHLQLILGLVMYFMSPTVEVALASEDMMKVAPLRYWAVEHISMMILGIAVATIGYSRAKRAVTDIARAKRVFWMYLIAFIIIIASIPWPFRAVGIARPLF